MWDAVRVQKCDVATGASFVEPGEIIPELGYNSASRPHPKLNVTRAPSRLYEDSDSWRDR